MINNSFHLKKLKHLNNIKRNGIFYKKLIWADRPKNVSIFLIQIIYVKIKQKL